jgi:Ca2+/H+ antiporter, TMEM165/GDT1 family
MRHISKEKRFMLIPLFIIGGAALVGLFGWIVMLLWNAILVPAAGASALTFWQGLGLLVLSRILVGGFGGGKGRRGKGNWANMTAEERMQFRQEWKQRCGGGPFNERNKETSPDPVQ